MHSILLVLVSSPFLVCTSLTRSHTFAKFLIDALPPLSQTAKDKRTIKPEGSAKIPDDAYVLELSEKQFCTVNSAKKPCILTFYDRISTANGTHVPNPILK